MTHLPPPRIAAVHDLSCLGRCALTVILPTLSVMGYQVVPIPTSLLSTHTGGFEGLYFKDLTDDMGEISAHFSRLGTTFRAIYTGFLGSAKQIDSVKELIDRFGDRPDESGKKPLIFIDPVMGDDGKLYSTYTPELVVGVRDLTLRAEVLTPNLTEACLLTQKDYRDTSRMSASDAENYAQELLQALCAQTHARAVITGIRLSDGRLANVGKDADGRMFTVATPIRGCAYPGTGDIFASVLLGELLAESDFETACARAAEFTGETIAISTGIQSPVRNGVALEYVLPLLAKR